MEIGDARKVLASSPAFGYVPEGMFTILLIGMAVLYGALMVALAAGVTLSRSAAPPPALLRVSIIIPARNEETMIGRCLESVARLRYPPHLLEAIIVNDGSTDATAEIIATYARDTPWMKAITVPAYEAATTGKTRALAEGIAASHGDILMFTDADCTVPPDWVAATAGRFGDPSVGLVAGFTLLRGETIWERMQAVDWLFLFSLAAGALRLGVPVTAVGNNLSVRRSAYEATGGYAAIPFSVTEDLALFRAVLAPGRFRALFPLDPATLVESEPCRTAGALFRQKQRWFLGGTDMDALSLSIVGMAFLFHALLLASPFLLPPGVWLPVLLARCGAETLVLLPSFRAFRRTALAGALPAFFFVLPVTVLLFPPLALLYRRVSWKGRTFGTP